MLLKRRRAPERRPAVVGESAGKGGMNAGKWRKTSVNLRQFPVTIKKRRPFSRMYRYRLAWESSSQSRWNRKAMAARNDGVPLL